MPRAGLLIAVVAILVVAVVGSLIWTGAIDLGVSSDVAKPAQIDLPSTTGQEVKLMAVLDNVASGGGYAASFLETEVPKWQIASGHTIERFSIGSGGPTFARLTSTGILDEASVQWPQLGLTTMLPLEFATLSNGKKLQVGIIARSARANGSDVMSVVYATQQAGNSGWQKVKLGGDFSVYTFEFDVPPVEAGYTNAPIVAIHSDASGNGKAIELIGLYVKLIQ